MKKMVIISDIFILLLLAGCTKKTVETTGTGIITAEPDEAVIYTTIETSAETADKAKQDNQQIINNINTVLTKLGVQKEDVVTDSYFLYEEIDWINYTRKSKGFSLTNSIKIKTRNFDNVKKIVDSILEAGATRIETINLELSDSKQNELKKQVLSEASSDAKEKAEAIAEGAGAQIKKLTYISDLNFEYAPYSLFDNDLMNKETLGKIATDISPQRLEVTATVEATYSIR